MTGAECIDLTTMMSMVGLFEKDSVDDYYKWSNKQTKGAIYCRILGNMDWLQDNIGYTLKILPPNVSDHALLCLSGQEKQVIRKTHFKFLNCVVDLNGYDDNVKKRWNGHIEGKLMYVLWKKLKRTQPILKKFDKPVLNIQQKLSKLGMIFMLLNLHLVLIE